MLDNYLIKKFRIILFLFLILLIIFGANAVISFPNNSFSELKLINQYNSSTNNFKSFNIYDYEDAISKAQFKAQIIEFDNEEELDSWIKNKVEKKSEIKTINRNIVFVDENKNYVFWRNKATFIQIIALRDNIPKLEALKLAFAPGGVGVLPEYLIGDYLEKYPSECTEDNCMSQNSLLDEKVREGLFWFLRPPNDIKGLTYYMDGGGDCPNDDTGFERIKKIFLLTDEELGEVRSHCLNNKNYEIAGAEIPPELKECGKKIDLSIKNNGISEYDSRVILGECALRARFTEDYNYSDEELISLFDKRNEMVKDKIISLNSLREKSKSSTSQDKINKIVEEKMAKRNLSYIGKGEEKPSNDNNKINISKPQGRLVSPRLAYLNGLTEREVGRSPYTYLWFEESQNV